MSLKLYRTTHGVVAERDGQCFALPGRTLPDLLNDPALASLAPGPGSVLSALPPLLAPVEDPQEVWAAGVTYLRSREARQEEVKAASGGDGDFYAKVYAAERPELFFKSLPRRVAAPGAPVRIRRDATWQVPEPELAVVANRHGQIVGWTIGNDMSARDLEGENPLYLPQAKTWEGACALGPAIVVGAPPSSCPVQLRVYRGGALATEGATDLAQMKRRPAELVEWLFRECSFPAGVILLTGTGIVPAADFSLRSGDEIRITLGEAGELRNPVA